MTDSNDKPQKPNVNAENNSIAVGGISAGGDISGNIHVGNVGYSIEEVSVLITQISTTFTPKPFDGRCPYKGLDVFEEEDAELFFGREKLVDDLVGRVKESRTVFVTGPSGSGKSSLVRAGLIHALKQGAIKNSDRWLYETMKPGRDPLAELARVTASLAGSTNAEDEINAKAMADATIFARWCEIALKDGRDKRVVLFIDQFEEVFTQISIEEERVSFLNLVTHAATVENGRIIILFSMRSDFVSNCATYPQLNALLNQQFVQIGAMQPEELVSAIAQPALRVGLRIDPDLIAQIINDMKGEPGALPLMQFALKDLFDSQGEKSGVIALTLNDYLQRGGIHKALERHADDSFSKLSKSEQELARSIFSGLIEIGWGTQDTRRTVMINELVSDNKEREAIEAIIHKLADARLLTSHESSVSLAHEKLIDAWPWLKKLVNENRDLIALQNEISGDAKEWSDHQYDPSYLYRGARLANAQEQIDAKKLWVSGLAKKFIQAAVESYDNELEEAKKRGERLLQLSNIALARQLGAQAQSIIATRNSKQMLAVLLATQAMKILPSNDSAQVLLNNNFAAKFVLRAAHDHKVNSVAFSSDGKLMVSGSGDYTARIWEIATGKELVRFTHDLEVIKVAFSLDGKYVISGSTDHTARVWYVSTGQEISRMTHDSFVNSIAISPDGNYAISGGDHTARLWEVDTGKEVARATHAKSLLGVRSVAISPDGKLMASAGDSMVRVWKPEASSRGFASLFRLTKNSNYSASIEVAHKFHNNSPVTSIAFSPDGKYIVSACQYGGLIFIWEVATGRDIAHFNHGDNRHALQVVASSPDGKYVASGGTDRTARVWDLTGQEVARITHDGEIIDLKFSPDGKYVISGSTDHTARVWEAATGQEIARMTHDKTVNSVAFSPDGKSAVSGSQDHTARVWDISKSIKVRSMLHQSKVNSIAFSPNGKYVVSGSYDHTVSVWNATTADEIAHMTHDDLVQSVAFSSDGNFVVSGSNDRTIRIWEALTGQEIRRMVYVKAAMKLAFSPDGKYVVSIHSDHIKTNDDVAIIWDATTGEAVHGIKEISDSGSSIAFSPNGKLMVLGHQHLPSYTDLASTINVETGEVIVSVPQEGGLTAASFSPDGKYVLSGSLMGTLRLWDAATGQIFADMIVQEKRHPGDSHFFSKDSILGEIVEPSIIGSVAFSQDGKYVAAGIRNLSFGLDDRPAIVWNSETGQEIARMVHSGDVTAASFLPLHNNYVVSSSSDKTIRVWEATTGHEIARMTHDMGVSAIACSPDGKSIVSGSEDGTIRVWMWHPEDLIADACSRLPRNLTRAEWKQYIGDALPYQAVCLNLPIEPESTTTPIAIP